MSLSNQIYWVFKSYTTRKTLWFFVGWYVLATIGLCLGAIVLERIPSGAIILIQHPQLGLILGLWLQFRAQTVTTIGAVTPRFWLPHQIVFAAMIALMWGIQSLTMLAWRADLLAASSVCGLMFIPWAMMQLTHDRVLAGDPAADKFRATAVFIPMAYVLIFCAVPILLSDQFTARFFAGAYPQLAWVLLGAGVFSVAAIVRGMPLKHRVLNESLNQLHSCELSWGQWVEWNQRNQQQQHSAKLQEKINRLFADVTPGCARHGNRKCTVHLRKANAMTGKSLLFFCVMLVVMTWVMHALLSLVLTGDMSRLFGSQSASILWMPLLAPSLILVQQWDLRRRTFVIDLMRPVTRRELIRNLFKAIALDTAIIAAVHTMNIIVYAAITRQSMQWSIPVVILMLDCYCLIAITALTLLTYPQNRRGIIVHIGLIVILLVVEIVSIDALFSSNVWSLAIELFALAAVVLLAAFTIVTKRRWRDLEWDT